ncbi:hypothetical protein V8B97DRAFT_2013702 [Scleroderma yunnanense]
MLTAVLGEFDKQIAFPVLLVVTDDFQAIYCKTKHHHPHFAWVQPYYLSMSWLLPECFGGLKAFVIHFPRIWNVYISLGTRRCLGRALGYIELTEAFDLSPMSDSGSYAKLLATNCRPIQRGLSRVEVSAALNAFTVSVELFDIWSRD